VFTERQFDADDHLAKFIRPGDQAEAEAGGCGGGCVILLFRRRFPL
jgi:hypothetical protein